MTITEALTKAVAGGYHMHESEGIDTDVVGANSACSAWCRAMKGKSEYSPACEK